MNKKLKSSFIFLFVLLTLSFSTMAFAANDNAKGSMDSSIYVEDGYVEISAEELTDGQTSISLTLYEDADGNYYFVRGNDPVPYWNSKGVYWEVNIDAWKGNAGLISFNCVSDTANLRYVSGEIYVESTSIFNPKTYFSVDPNKSYGTGQIRISDEYDFDTLGDKSMRFGFKDITIGSSVHGEISPPDDSAVLKAK